MATRHRNQGWDGLESVFGYRPSTQQERKLWGKLSDELNRAGATEESVLAAADRYARDMPNATITPTALVKHYERLMASRGRTGVGASLIKEAIQLRKDRESDGYGDSDDVRGRRLRGTPVEGVAGGDDRALDPGA